MEKGDFPFANPASLHASGQASRKLINQARETIYKTFSLKEKNFDLFFHSGSTEGIRTFFERLTKEDCFFYCLSDHAAVLALAQDLESKGISTQALAIDHNGDLEVETAIEMIKSYESNSNGRAYLNFLALHNETGVYWPFSIAEQLKEQTNVYIHVDATQVPGKVVDWNKLSTKLDAYTFSGHKFGAFKGIGFSFVKKDFGLVPLMKGGGQQGGIRGGTENTVSIHTIALALGDVLKADISSIQKMRDELEEVVRQNQNAMVVGEQSKYGRGVNTLNFVLKSKKADISLIQFDMAGLDVSSGSACSAGSVEPSKTLMEMGLQEYAKNGIRVSIGTENLSERDAILSKFKQVLKKL